MNQFGISESIALAIGLTIGIACVAVYVHFKTHKMQSYFTDTKAFYIKKWLYIFGIVTINVAMCVFVFYMKNLQVVVFLILALKTKDIIMSVIFTLNMVLYRNIRELITYVSPKAKEHYESKRKTVISENVLSLVPYYRETMGQVAQTVDSIQNSELRTNNVLVCVVSDGIRAYNDLVTEVVTEMTGYYVSWKGETVSVNMTFGLRNEKPIMMIHKNKNMGKKDTLILCHDLFNTLRLDAALMNRTLRSEVAEVLLTHFGLADFGYMFTTDADTILQKTSLITLMDEIHTRGALAACGILNVDKSGTKTITQVVWDGLQDFQYMYGQYVRRSCEDILDQIMCLPGCITLFKVGDHHQKALEMYAAKPTEDEFLASNVQYLGTDRRYTSCLIYTNDSNKIVWTDKAHAYTSVPQTWHQYVAQRKRWMSNMYFNTMLNICGKNVNALSRFFSLLDVIKLSLVYFRVFNTMFFIGLLVAYGSNKTVTEMIPYIVVLSFPGVMFFIYAIINSHLRRKFFQLCGALILNKIFVLFSSAIIFTVMLANIGSDVWNSKKDIIKTQLSQVVVEENVAVSQLNVDAVMSETKRWSDSTVETTDKMQEVVEK